MKKEESPKKQEANDNENILEKSENKEENEMRITRNNRYDKNFNYALTEGNVANQKNKLNTSVYNIKRTPKKYKLEIGQSDNFMNSVKKIFLYNNEHNKKKNFYNNIKLVDH